MKKPASATVFRNVIEGKQLRLVSGGSDPTVVPIVQAPSLKSERVQ